MDAPTAVYDRITVEEMATDGIEDVLWVGLSEVWG